jgi:hypothetical protein
VRPVHTWTDPAQHVSKDFHEHALSEDFKLMLLSVEDADLNISGTIEDGLPKHMM